MKAREILESAQYLKISFKHTTDIKITHEIFHIFIQRLHI